MDFIALQGLRFISDILSRKISLEVRSSGTYDLVVKSFAGHLQFLFAFIVNQESANGAIATTSFEGAGTKRISDTQAKDCA